MARVPSPITSPPEVPGQPYNAADSGPAQPSQSAPTQVYDADGGSDSSEPWPKIQEAGAADWSSGRITGGWPGNGDSSAGPWKQC